MKRTLRVTLWAMSFVAAILFAMLIAPARVSAQETFDIKVASAADNNLGGEFPLDYTIEYANGSLQDIHIDGEGTTSYTSPDGSGAPVAFHYLGIRYVVTAGKWCGPANPANGGCWCFCLQWVRVGWIVFPRWFWYWDPCCNK